MEVIPRVEMIFYMFKLLQPLLPTVFINMEVILYLEMIFDSLFLFGYLRSTSVKSTYVIILLEFLRMFGNHDSNILVSFICLYEISTTLRE